MGIKTMTRRETYRNPVISGFYPDPSICYDGNNYYIVNSSFYYFPGLPVFQSKDLVHWKQIGNAISRPEQLDYKNCDSSEGLWAATIRYLDNKYYIVNTLDVNGRKNRYNYIITADTPSGPWSNAVIIHNAGGIDPSLFFDDDGRMWFCANRIPDKELFPSHKQIYLVELDKNSFQMIGEPTVIYDAVVDHSMYMEGPHIYHIHDWYYLLTAEGGTQTNHCVKFYRSRKLQGPYEPCPRNPIVTNRHIKLINTTGVSVTGHGDLVEYAPDKYAMVLLGIRPYEKNIDPFKYEIHRKWIREPDRNKKAQFNLGRETFLVRIAFDYDDWPIIENDNGLVNINEIRPDLREYIFPMQSRIDNFENSELGLEWCMRRPPIKEFYSLSERPGYLRLHLQKESSESTSTPAMILRRQQHYYFQAGVAMEFESENENEEAGLILTQNEGYSYLLLKKNESNHDTLACIKVENGHREVINKVQIPKGRIYLTIEGHKETYNFYYGLRERETIAISESVDASLLSTIVADGYLGTMIGMYASGMGHNSNNDADFDWFRYELLNTDDTY